MMGRKITVLLSVFAIFAVASVVSAQPPATVAVDVTPAEVPVSVAIPAHAKEVASGVFSLGTAVDSRGREVQGFILFHHREGHTGGPDGGGPGNGGGDSQCYALFAKDARWQTPESYFFNATNNDGLPGSFVGDVLASGIGEWETNASAKIFGGGSEIGAVLEADFDAPDDINEVYFASMPDEPNTLAFTLVWGVFNGPPFAREIISWDMVFNDDFVWGDVETSAAPWDLLNVATHELGHAAGLTHPDNACTEETMFASAAPDETKKRDLNAGDITGINKLY